MSTSYSRNLSKKYGTMKSKNDSEMAQDRSTIILKTESHGLIRLPTHWQKYLRIPFRTRKASEYTTLKEA
jgi:hypothetical protein